MKNVISFLFGLFIALPSSLVARDIDFDSQVKPILNKYCVSCHNDREAEGDFSAASFESFKRGGENGATFAAGDQNKSLIMKLVRGTAEPKMPPENEPQPTQKEIETLGKWIDLGAIPPSSGTGDARAFVPPLLKGAAKTTPSVTSVDWSSSNLIAVSRYRSVEFVSPKSQKVSRTLTDFPGKVNSVRFNSSGDFLAVASGITGHSGQASIWSVETGELLRRFSGHDDTLYCAVMSPDSKILVTAGYDQQIMIWNIESGKLIRKFQGHNGAIYDLDISKDSKNLISAGGDQTVKVWELATGKRLDTLGQPLKEQLSTRFAPDNRLIYAGGSDNRIRAWEFKSRKSTQINPLKMSRFAHEAPIVSLCFSPDGTHLISTSEDKTLKIWDAKSLTLKSSLSGQSDVCTGIAVSPNNDQFFVGRMDGSTQMHPLRSTEPSPTIVSMSAGARREASQRNTERTKTAESEPNNQPDKANELAVPGMVTGTIAGDENLEDMDCFRFRGMAGETLIFEVKAARNKSPLDSKIEILDLNGTPVPRVVLRAVRDSYFTFRGKDSFQSGDFRIHNWEEMNLNNYLYANGEVIKLFLHPRGPDSGFNVYPGFGRRHGFFGTTSFSHALHEPCYIVEPHPVGSTFPPNGLPVFHLNYENDDDSKRQLGNDSRLFFEVPKTGEYIVRVTDVRGFAGPEFKYELAVRTPKPDFRVKLNVPGDFQQSGGREFSLTANRVDGFSGMINVIAENVPENLYVSSPLVIESGHYRAFGTIHVIPGRTPPTVEQLKQIQFVASAKIDGADVEHSIHGIQKIKVTDQPRVSIRVVKPGTPKEEAFSGSLDEPVVFEAYPGTRIEALVYAQRTGHRGRIAFGNEDSGRNLPHGVYVDDIGLNGLMITKDNDAQRFVITVEPWVKPTTAHFHIRSNNVQGQASWPLILKVLEKPSQ